MSDNEPTLAELKEVFRYDPVTGILYRRAINTRWGIKSCREEEVGVRGSSHGYLEVKHKKKYLVHRLVWALTYGSWPNIIDHINGDKHNNALTNLRNCDQSVNAYNGPKRVNNTTGYIGVTVQQGRYIARTTHFYKSIHIGSFNTAEEAATARRAYMKEHFNHG